MSRRTRSVVLLGVVGLMLLAGYLLGRLEDSRDDSPPDVPDAELALANRWARGISPGRFAILAGDELNAN